jgi:hypothetical protein
LIDDVSLIELNLPAFAGRDTSIFVGDSVYLGRESDVGIDEACVWYKLTSSTTNVTIDTIAGFWIKPSITSTYVLRQEICGLVKWDTVTIYMDAVGIEKLKILNEELKIYPVPAKDFVELNVNNKALLREFTMLNIFNNIGQSIREEEVNFKENTIKILTHDLPEGIYFITIRNAMNEKVTKKLLIAK